MSSLAPLDERMKWLRTDTIPPAADLARPLVEALHPLLNHLGEGQAELYTFEFDMSEDQLEEMKAHLVRFHDTAHRVAQIFAAAAKGCSVRNQHAAYEHAYGLVMAITDVQQISYLRFHEDETMQNEVTS